MNSIAVKFRKIVSYTLLGIGVSFVALPSAHAQFFVGGAFFFACGLLNDSPVPPIPGADAVNYYSNSVTETAGPPNGEGLRRVTIKDVVKQHNANGAVNWQRTLMVTGLPVAQAFGVPPFQDLAYLEFLDLSGRPASPVFPFPGACKAYGLAEHNGKEYGLVGLGTVGQEDMGTPFPVTAKDKAPAVNAASGSAPLALIKGRDKTIMNWWTLNLANGNIVRQIKPRPKPGEFQLPNESGAWDIDNDGNVELVIVSVKFVGELNYDFIYRIYNIVTGVMKKETTIRQLNRQVIK